MKLENGRLSIGFADVLRVVFFPIYLIVLGQWAMWRKHETVVVEKEWIWRLSMALYWTVLVGTGVWFAIHTLTYHREIVSVETIAEGPVKVMDACLVKIEERPKFFNTDQVKTWRFCRSNEIWYQVEDDGTLVSLGSDRGLPPAWELNRATYLDELLDAYAPLRKISEYRKELEQKIRLLPTW